jgi:hypothetical protein
MVFPGGACRYPGATEASHFHAHLFLCKPPTLNQESISWMGQAPGAHGNQLNVPDLVVMDKYLSNFARMARIFIIFNNPILGQLILTHPPIEELDHWAPSCWKWSGDYAC